MGPVGTRIVDLEEYNHAFDFNLEPNFIDKRIFHKNAASRNLYLSCKKYNAFVVNKIPHGGGNQPPRSHRVTLFLYIVPMSWKEEYELEVTIPATDFLFDFLDDSSINFSSIDNMYVREWCEAVPDFYKHCDGEVESA